MTGEEMQRAIDFILAQQAKFVEQDHQMQQRLEQTSAEHTRRFEEMSAEHLSRMAVLEEIVTQNRQLIQTLAERQLATEDDVITQRERLEEDEKRIARFERSYLTISDLLAKHDAQLVIVTDSVNDVIDKQEVHEEQLVEIRDAQLAEIKENIVTLTANINELTTNVNRYISARNNGSNETRDN